MGSSSPGNPRKFSLRQSPFCEKYERFNSGDGQDKMQKNIQSKKDALKAFPERFSNSDSEVEKQKGAFNVRPKKNPRRRLSMSDSITVMAKGESTTVLSISSPRKPQWRLFLRDSTHRSRRRKTEGCSRFRAQENPPRDFTEQQWQRGNGKWCSQYPVQESPATTVAMTKPKCRTMIRISRPIMDFP